MTTTTQAKQAVYKLFTDSWTNGTRAVFDNESFDPDSITEPWVRITAKNVLGRQESIGGVNNRKFIRQGLILAQVFTQTGQGTKPADDLAELIKEIFEAKRFDDVWTKVAVIRDIGVDGGWYQNQVQIEFFYDEVK